MRVTSIGQVTIPISIRKLLSITPGTEIEFKEDNGKLYIIKAKLPSNTGKFKKVRGIATTKMSTNEIISLTRQTV